MYSVNGFAFGFILLSTGLSSYGLECKNGGIQESSGSCNCTNSCVSGATCETHSRCGTFPLVSHTTSTWGQFSGDCDVTVSVQCIPGYRFVDTLATELIRNFSCIGGSTWSGPTTACTRVVCYLEDPGRYHTVMDIARDQVLYYGDKVSYKCWDYHERVFGNRERLCLANGTLSGAHPYCQVHVTLAMIVSLSILVLCLLLLIYLVYNFIRYKQRVNFIKEEKQRLGDPIEKERVGMNVILKKATRPKTAKRMSQWKPSMNPGQIQRLRLPDMFAQYLSDYEEKGDIFSSGDEEGSPELQRTPVINMRSVCQKISETQKEKLPAAEKYALQ